MTHKILFACAASQILIPTLGSINDCWWREVCGYKGWTNWWSFLPFAAYTYAHHHTCECVCLDDDCMSTVCASVCVLLWSSSRCEALQTWNKIVTARPWKSHQEKCCVVSMPHRNTHIHVSTAFMYILHSLIWASDHTSCILLIQHML